MIDTVKELKRFLEPVKGGTYTAFLKSVMNTDGIEKYQLHHKHRRTPSEKVDPEVAKEFLKKYRNRIANLPINKSSTDIHVFVK